MPLEQFRQPVVTPAAPVIGMPGLTTQLGAVVGEQGAEVTGAVQVTGLVVVVIVAIVVWVAYRMGG